MCCKGILKRVLPFFLTLAVGLFIASFFVDLTPRLNFPERRLGRCHNFETSYYQEHERAERLQQQLDQLDQNPVPLKWGDTMSVPPPPPAPVMAPHVAR
jgi:hypothetical protein